MCHRAEQISNLFLPDTNSLLAVRLHEEKGALREGKPQTTDFHFPKSVTTWQLLRQVDTMVKFLEATQNRRHQPSMHLYPTV